MVANIKGLSVTSVNLSHLSQSVVLQQERLGRSLSRTTYDNATMPAISLIKVKVGISN